MEEKVFVGFNYGTFVTDDGEPKEYCNVFIVEPFSGDATALYHFGGQKTEKYGSDNPAVFFGMDPGTRVECFFRSAMATNGWILQLKKRNCEFVT